MKKNVIFIFLLFCFSYILFSIEFSIDLKNYTDCKPLVYDLDSDNELEIVVACENGTLHLFETDGTQIINGHWIRHVSGPVQQKVQVLDTDKGKKIIISTYDGKVYSLDVTGEKSSGWEDEIDVNNINQDYYITSAPGVDSKNEKIFFSSTQGIVYIVDKNKDFLWNFKADGPVSTQILFDDIDGDGESEYIFKSDTGTLYSYSESFKSKRGFPYFVKENYKSAPYPMTIEDLDDDGFKEIVFATNEYKGKYYIYAVSGNGNVLAKVPVQSKIYKEIELIDIDNDGKKDFIFNTVNGMTGIKGIDGKYKEGWPVKTGSKIKGKPYIIDIDSDGIPEILVIKSDDGENYYLQPYDAWGKKTGEAVYIGVMDDLMDFNAFSIADIDSNGKLELLFYNNMKFNAIETEYYTPVNIEVIGIEYKY